MAAGAAALGAVSVWGTSAALGISTHSWEVAISLPVSHWFSPAALAALSPTSAFGMGASASTGVPLTWPFVMAVSVPASISVRPAWAMVGSVWTRWAGSTGSLSLGVVSRAEGSVDSVSVFREASSIGPSGATCALATASSLMVATVARQQTEKTNTPDKKLTGGLQRRAIDATGRIVGALVQLDHDIYSTLITSIDTQ